MTTSVETRASWTAALASLAIQSVTYGSPLIIVVALKPIAADLGESRSMVALASSAGWIGAGLGGLLMGWLAERIGLRRVTAIGSASIALGLLVASWGGIFGLYFGCFLLVGLL